MVLSRDLKVVPDKLLPHRVNAAGNSKIREGRRMDTGQDFDQYRRRDERKKYEAEVFFSVSQKAYTATIKNISRGGALVHTGGMPVITPGELIIITIPFTTRAQSVKRKARVMWVDSQVMGVQFY
jgi:hypothetical protein